MIDLAHVPTEDLIRCGISQTEPIVQADHPEACAAWRDWLKHNKVTLKDVGRELDRRRT